MKSHGSTTRPNPISPPPNGGARWAGPGCALLLIVLGGLCSRYVAAQLSDSSSEHIQLPQPLRSLPMVLGDWQGTDVEIPAGVLRIAGNDDYVCRQYENASTRESVSVYVAYTARPRTMLRHRPAVCYPNAGWSLASRQELQVSILGQSHPVASFRFSRPDLEAARIVVTNFYVLNGRWTIDENSFWGLGWRDPNLARDASRYVAQVQIAVPVRGDYDRAEAVAARFLQAAARELLNLLPGAASQPAGD